jgi:hypothetical protein
MTILEQLMSIKGYEYIIAGMFLFVFILFYRFLSTDRIDDEE